jgi:hypothetical protein
MGYQDELFKHNEITGGYGVDGDWRFFYMDVQEQGIYEMPTDNRRLYIDVEWEHDLTDVDVQVYGGHEVASDVLGNTLPSDVYGPHTISHVGGSDVTADFFTTTGGPSEIIAPEISSGVNVIALHTVGMNASVDYNETFSARVGTMYVDPTEVSVVSNKLYGEQTINMYSNREWEGVGGIAAGPSAPESLKNLTVEQDDPDWSNFDTFEQQLASGTTVYSRTIEDCLIFHVHIWGHTDFGYGDVSDLDLGVFLDGSGEIDFPDGIVQEDEFVAMGADFDADEEVKLIAPVDGTYLIVVYGFTLVMDPAHFDMDITIVQGTGFEVSGTGVNSLSADQVGFFASNQTEEPFNLTELTLSWDLPGSSTGSLQGALYIGPGNGPMSMLIPIELTIDTTAPVISDSTFPKEGDVTNDNTPLIYGGVRDSEREEIDKESLKLIVDGEDITSLASVSVDFISNTAGSGYPTGSAQYTPNVPLSEGGHIVEFRASDWAENEAIKTWAFTVDTKAPSLTLDIVSDTIYTNQPSYEIMGAAEMDSSVIVMIGALSANVKRDAVGGFTATVDLFTDDAGNVNTKYVTIILDNVVPEFDRLICLDGTLTNQPNTILSGSMSEGGSLVVNGDPATVNSDGTFDKNVELIEGENIFELQYTDLAGNMAYDWLNVTLDTQAPSININPFETSVSSDSFNISGTTEAGAFVRVNGKLVQVTGTRQTTGSFSKAIRLSPGTNTLVIESRDSIGNINQVYVTVNYEVSGTNYGAIGLMILLLIVGLLVGIFLARMIFGTAPAEEDESEEPVSDEIPDEDVGEDIDEDMPKDEDIDSEDDSMDDDIPEEDVEDIPDEDISEDIGEPEVPEEEDELEPFDGEPEPLEPEEVTSEEIADDIVAEEAVEESLDEDVAEPEVPEEDERILKLKQAFEEGKISEELYEKNLKKMQGN